MRAEQPALEADLDHGADDSDLDLEPAVLGADAVVGAGEGDRPARVDLPRHRDRARSHGSLRCGLPAIRGGAFLLDRMPARVGGDEPAAVLEVDERAVA